MDKHHIAQTQEVCLHMEDTNAEILFLSWHKNSDYHSHKCPPFVFLFHLVWNIDLCMLMTKNKHVAQSFRASCMLPSKIPSCDGVWDLRGKWPQSHELFTRQRKVQIWVTPQRNKDSIGPLVLCWGRRLTLNQCRENLRQMSRKCVWSVFTNEFLSSRTSQRSVSLYSKLKLLHLLLGM